MVDDLFLATLREDHKRRRVYLRAGQRLDLQAQALCRRLCDGNKIEARKLWRAVKKGQDSGHAAYLTAAVHCLPLIEAIALLRSYRMPLQRNMVKAAKELPVWPWAEKIGGLGPLGLAQMIGEIAVDKDPRKGRGTGRTTLSDFPTPSKLWTWWGVGLVKINGVWVAQRRVKGEEAKKHRFNPQRRSIMHVIGSSLLKYTRGPNPYRDLYLARKEWERAKQPEAPAFILHKMSQRYVEKRLLLHLWRAWRECS